MKFLKTLITLTLIALVLASCDINDDRDPHPNVENKWLSFDSKNELQSF